MTAKNNVQRLVTSTIKEHITANTHKKHQPRNKTFNIRCTELKGFYIRVLPSGLKTYMVNGRLGGSGKQKYPKVGDCMIVPFDEARETARDYLYKLSQGTDPVLQERKDISLKLTLAKAFQDYIEVIKDYRQVRTVEDYERRIELNLKPLKNKAIGEITVQDVKDWWKSCNKKRSDELALMYACVVMDEYVSDETIEKNPFRLAKISNSVKNTIKPLGEVEQHIPMRHIQNYVKAMFGCWDKLGSSMRDLVFFCFLTGKRLDESRKLKWSDIDFDEGVIRIQKLNTKMKQADYVPMTPYLMLLLTERERNSVENYKDGIYAPNDYVFWSTIKKGVSVDDPTKCLQRIWSEIPIQDRFELEKGTYITLHDIRRTVGTASAELGFGLEDTSSILAHKKKTVTQKYILLSNEYKREKLIQVQQYLNTQSNDGFLLLLNRFYGGVDIGIPQPDEQVKKSYREEQSHWFND